MNPPIYFDHAATTPLRAEALAAMEPYLTESYGNPSSIYRLAQAARSALDAARDTIAGCLGAQPSEIIFTGGGTESNNAAIKGVALARRNEGKQLVTSAIEHHAVLHPFEELVELHSFEVTTVPVSSEGLVDPADVESALRDDTVLASVMWANNEIGTIQPIAEIGEVLGRRGVTFHVDAVQGAGVLPINLGSLPIDLMSISAHKFYGPKGVGAMYVRRGTPWWPLLTGGGQERNRRAGTENVAGIVGMAKALELAVAEMEVVNTRISAMRDCLFEQVVSRIPDTRINGAMDPRLHNNANFSFSGISGEALLAALDLAGIMASSGSACTSGSLEPSHVLQAIGRSDSLARSSVRLTLGRENTTEELERVIGTLETLVARQRDVGSVEHRSPVGVLGPA